MPTRAYLTDDVDLMRGSVDDEGGSRYDGLSQNVPDGYVCDLQTDLAVLGFNEVGRPDGAFGQNTRIALQAFQALAGLDATGIADGGTRDALRHWLEGGHTRTSPPASATPSFLSRDTFHFIEPRVPHFSQGDRQWCERVLGRNHTIQKMGCAVSCIAMVLRHAGRNVDPGTLDEFLDGHDGYEGDSVRWSVAAGCAAGANDGLAYDRRKGGEQELLPVLVDRIDRNRPTLVRVDYGTDGDLQYNHFVLAVGRSDDGTLILMNDPATRNGDAYAQPVDENIIQRTTRKSGYRIVQLDWFD